MTKVNPIMKLVSDIARIEYETLPIIEPAQDLTSIICYKFDVKTGKITSKTINADVGKTAKEAFSAEIIRIWYGLEKLKIEDDARRIIERIDKALQARNKAIDAKEGTETPALTEVERLQCDAAKRRIEANESVLLHHIESVAKSQVYASNLTARLFVHVYRNDRLTDSDISIFSDLYKEGKKIIDARKNAVYSAVEDPTSASKALRERAETALRTVWKPESGLIEEYNIYVGKRLGDQLYSILHKGFTTNKSGDIVSRDAKAADMTREVLLALFGDLQIKNAKRRADSKPAPDEVTIATATTAADIKTDSKTDSETDSKPAPAPAKDKPKRNSKSKTKTDTTPADSTPADTTPEAKTA